MHTTCPKKHGITDEQLHTLAAWPDSPYFDEPPRAALALAEAGTRLADRPDAVPDDVWNMAAKQFDEPALVALVLTIALIKLQPAQRDYWPGRRRVDRPICQLATPA
jgi:alkylhydroperoxidase family enzyme